MVYLTQNLRFHPYEQMTVSKCKGESSVCTRPELQISPIRNKCGFPTTKGYPYSSPDQSLRFHIYEQYVDVRIQTDILIVYRPGLRISAVRKLLISKFEEVSLFRTRPKT